jgi:hypothetical protein
MVLRQTPYSVASCAIEGSFVAICPVSIFFLRAAAMVL